nr:TPA: ND4L [Bombus confusus]
MLNLLIFNLIIMMFFVLLNFNIYYLNFLIGMEYMIIMVLFYMILFNFNNWIFLIYLIYSVIEAVLGLSLLVSMNYEFGHQKINFINLIF